MVTKKKRRRSKKKTSSGLTEQQRYDSVSVTGSGRDVEADSLTEGSSQPEADMAEDTPLVYNPETNFGPKAANFFHREVANSSVADRYDIDNTPPEDVLLKARDLAINCLQPIRSYYGLSFAPNSWFRCEALEKVICTQSFIKWRAKHGYDRKPDAWSLYFAKKSHPKGAAADIEIPGVDNDELYDWCLAELTFDQLIREFPKPEEPNSGWVHISYNAANNRGEAFTIP